jgi:DNA replication and repair protein RecF
LRETIQWEQSHALLKGVVQAGASRIAGDGASVGKTLAVQVEPRTRTAFLNAKPCRATKEYLRILPATAFIPDDLDLVKGMPAGRRYFLDRGAFQYYPPYWTLLTTYNKTLQQKNALLRELKDGKNRGGVSATQRAAEDVWNVQLQEVGSQVIVQRLKFVAHLQQWVQHIYEQWLATGERITLRYKTSIERYVDADLAVDNAVSLSPLVTAYGEALRQNVEREHRLGLCVLGPHRDDLDIEFGGRPLRAYGSQGQQRTAVLALKLAEMYVYFDRYAEHAVLLLDDVTSELDETRSRKLFEYVQHGMQVFISTTSKPDLPVDRSLACAYFDLSARS